MDNDEAKREQAEALLTALVDGIERQNEIAERQVEAIAKQNELVERDLESREELIETIEELSGLLIKGEHFLKFMSEKVLTEKKPVWESVGEVLQKLEQIEAEFLPE